MPNRDGTGPQGQGPRTGRGLGRCANNGSSNQSPRTSGQGMGMGRGVRR